MGAYLRLLRDRPFRLLWLGATISIFGDALTWVSLVWLTYDLGGSAVQIGLLAACYTGPVIVGGLVAGVLLDRFDRRRLLIADNLIRGLAMASVPIAATAGVLTQAQLYLVAAVYGSLYMVSLAGFPAMIPDLVAEDDLSTANAMESISYGVGGVVGPVAAGLLIGVIGAADVLGLDALTYLTFVACLVAMPRSSAAHPPSPAGERRDGGLRPAIRFLRRTPAVLAITLMFMSINIGEGMLTVLLPVFARDVLGVGAPGYGLLVSAMTLGLLVGSVVVGGLRWRWPLGRSIAAAQLCAGVAIFGLAVAPGLVASASVLFAFGLAASPLTIWAQTIRLRLIPGEMRGRVMSLLRTLMQSTPPLGGLIAGALLGAGMAGPALVLIAAVAGLPGAVGLVHPSLSRQATDRRAGRSGLDQAEDGRAASWTAEDDPDRPRDQPDDDDGEDPERHQSERQSERPSPITG
jgi:MFS family permease